ncbi:isoaspartyl peptidase/L-asparaginase-like [Dendronephthya gigantea]|uniref:isoaspartyl peptidase/L-asparaginase-like n=1 Tax=Dendronephthya gigantea TaxID=151771 RepID=UPI00106BE09D|nr:isoaspartyl peptidase/L-asparaginase-like [Dendronephthya gigantea]
MDIRDRVQEVGKRCAQNEPEYNIEQITDLDQFKAMKASLSDEETSKLLLSKLNSIGGLSVKDNARNIMSSHSKTSSFEYFLIQIGGTAVDAVEAAVRHLEEDPRFNAGRGSFVNSEKKVECDAMIMDGETLTAGAVMAVQHFLHPVSLSRAVMDKSTHCVLCSDGAHKFAKSIGFTPILENPDHLIVSEEDKTACAIESMHECVASTLDSYCCDSVAAVAMDENGHLACAISTGGTPNKLKGRVGDAPLIGCGGYANEHGAAATCGHGESIIKLTLAKEIVYNIEGGQNAQEAADNAVKKLDSDDRVVPFAGVIAIDKEGNVGIKTNTTFMPWASIKNDEMEYMSYESA